MEFPAFNCQISVHCSRPRHLSLLRAGHSGQRRLAESIMGRLEGIGIGGVRGARCPQGPEQAVVLPGAVPSLAPTPVLPWTRGLPARSTAIQWASQPQPRCGPVACGARSFPVVLGSVGSSPAPLAFPSKYQ